MEADMSQRSVDVGSLNDGEVALIERLIKRLSNGAEGEKGAVVSFLHDFLHDQGRSTQSAIVLPYADERVSSMYGYQNGFRFRTPRTQTRELLKLFPGLDASHVKRLVQAKGKRHPQAEFTPVIPKWQAIANTYGEALMIVVALLKKLHGDKFNNYRGEKLTDEHMRLVEKTAQAYQQLASSQPGDFLVFDAQFGKRWAGASIRHGRVRYLQEEFGLGPFETGILLLTHPDRITGNDQLYIDCSGVEYRDDPKAVFSLCRSFYWFGIYRLLALSCSGLDDRDEQWGAASGFLPQCP